MAVVWLVGLGSPAGAHALLLRSEPVAQTTVTTAPRVVRLEFSEPVEVAFGAVRVFDVDGHRVDSGKVTRTGGDRKIEVALLAMRNGTYTVTWRVASGDGHAVHGGFGFFVGAPSAVSGPAIPADEAGSRVVGWGFGVVRFAWFAGLIAAVGVVVVRRWVWTPASVTAGVDRTTAASDFRRWAGRALIGGWVVLVVAGVLSLVFQTASVSGLTLARAARPTALREVLSTEFGHYWLLSIGCTAVLAVPVAGLVRRRGLWGRSPSSWICLGGLAVAGLCLAAALNGHARTSGHPFLGVTSVTVHLGAVSVWVGGLGALVILGGLGWRSLDPDARARLLRALLGRFSGVAMVAAGAVIVSGVLNALSGLAALVDLWRTTYGRVVLAKVALVLIALALAARHRFVVPRRLAVPTSAGATAVGFARSSGAELTVLVGVVALSAGLVVLVPSRTLAGAADATVNLEHQAGPDRIRLFLDPSFPGDNQVHLSYVNGEGLADTSITQVEAILRHAGANRGEPIGPLPLRLIAPGRFVADVSIPDAGRYQLVVNAHGPVPGTTFDFRVKQGVGPQ